MLKDYLITCIFKLAVACQDGKEIELSDKARDFLECDLNVQALTSRIPKYGQEIIDSHQSQSSNAAALSTVASVYGVRSYMVHKGLLMDEEIAPANEPQKYFVDMPESPVPENTRKNIALAMESFERSAELGNVRSMGSVVMWAHKSAHPDFNSLNKEWTPKAAQAQTPNPNSMIDYGDMLGEGKITPESKVKAVKMYSQAAEFGLEKAEKRLQDLERLSMMQEDSWAARMRAEEQNQSNQNVR